MAKPEYQTNPVSDSSFWEERYQAGQPGWDLGRPAPAFEDLLSASDRPAPGRIAVVGCGRGSDAYLFARQGFAVVGFDFAPSAVEASRAGAASEGLTTAEFVRADIFAIPEAYRGSFDYVLEHACFCAIDPARRAEYVEVIRKLLRPGGSLIALFMAHGQPGGPPFTTDADEIRRLFGAAFEIERLEPPANSVESRRGKEILGILRRI